MSGADDGRELSPSERYARWSAERALEGTELDRFRARFSFELDPFQIDACVALQAGSSVLVAAPTGAGKTVVGEFAVQLGIAQGRRVFYTAPIKALSNQKHGELSAWLGSERVGLLTGDVSIRPDADVVVMTTEVLRNMLYAQSPALDDLGYVVMDEVHYLADRLRGPVWEEVIIQLPQTVQLVSLSATVSNAEEFGAWLDEVRGTTAVIVSETRPVPLWQHVVVGDDLVDLFVDAEGEAVVSHGPGASHSRIVNPALERLSFARADVDRRPGRDGQDGRGGRDDRGGRDERGGRGRRGTQGRHRPRGNPRDRRDDRRDDRREHGRDRGRDGGGGGGHARTNPFALRPPRRPDVVSLLDDEGLLPAIFFIFSRAGCDAAVRQCVFADLRLTTPEAKRTIRAVLDERLAAIPYEDVEVLQIPAFRRAAENGFAAHHAGMLPLLKSIVEELFAAGLIKAVFATETLALGINMPARSVVLEKLSKFNGVSHADLTPGEYTQLTGRAGRRGIDVEGHAIVVAGPGFDADAVAALASRRTYPLRSAFRPTYNMAVNLLDRFDTATARESLELSFAQFQADRSVVGLARRARELDETIASYRDALECDRGDILEYSDILERITGREKDLSRERATRDRDAARTALRRLRRGEIVAVPGGKRQGFAVVVSVRGDTLGGPEVLLLTTEGRLRTLRPEDAPTPPAVVDAMRVPDPDRFGKPKIRKDTAAALRARLAGRHQDPGRSVRAGARTPSTAATDALLAELREALRAHPCHDCPDLDKHLRWISRVRSVTKERDSVLRRIDGRTSTLARQFDRVCALLEELGYLERTGTDVDGHADLEPTASGLLLRRLFSERDLLIAQCLHEGVWESLDAPALAAMVSAVCYEARREGAEAATLPADPAFASALARTHRLGEELAAAERRHGLDATPEPDPGIAAVMHRWALGEHYAAAVGTSGLPAGDFVRQCRQVIDLLDQLVPVPVIGPVARDAIGRVRRGFVSQEISL
ncbi:DEAD/DEAH box helicase [Brachybacterium huguangmaarense]